MRYLRAGWWVAQASGAQLGSEQQGPHGLCAGGDT